MIALARAELLKLRSTRTALGLFVVVLVVTLVPLTVLIFAVPKDWLETDGVTGFLTTASALVPLVLLVFGILGMTNEYRHGTITYSYLVTPRRWQLMAMKLVVYAVVGIADHADRGRRWCTWSSASAAPSAACRSTRAEGPRSATTPGRSSSPA